MSHNRKPQSPEVQFRQLMKRMDLLTAAINRMAQANEALTQALLDDAGQAEEEEEPRTYMDGTPLG